MASYGLTLPVHARHAYAKRTGRWLPGAAARRLYRVWWARTCPQTRCGCGGRGKGRACRPPARPPARSFVAVAHAFCWHQYCVDGAVLLRCLSAIGLVTFAQGPARLPARLPARRSEAAEAAEGRTAEGRTAEAEHTACPARRPALKRSRIPVSGGRQAPDRVSVQRSAAAVSAAAWAAAARPARGPAAGGGSPRGAAAAAEAPAGAALPLGTCPRFRRAGPRRRPRRRATQWTRGCRRP